MQSMLLQFEVFGFYIMKFQNLNFTIWSYIIFVSTTSHSIFFIKGHMCLIRSIK